MVKDLKFLIPDLEKFVEKQIVRLTLEATANFVQATPVDTGWARANWVPQIGTPYTGGGPRPEVPPVGSANAARQTALSTVLNYKLTGARPVFISNNVPYIVKLNEGSSKQAPAAFVQRGIAQAVQTVAS
jgi:hypothetical protein